MPTTVTASGKLLVSRRSRPHGTARDSAARSTGRLGRWCLTLAAFAAGAGALAGQYLWFRVIAQADATDTRGSLVMLASALAGFGVGALAGRWLMTTRLRPGASIAAVSLVAAALTVLVYLQTLTWLAPMEPAPWLTLVWPAIYALPLVVLGLLFSIVTETGSGDAPGVPRAGSSSLAVMALGGALGGVVAWLWVLPSGGFDVLVKAIVLINVAVAVLAFPLINTRGRIATGIAATLGITMTVIGTLGQPQATAIAVDDDVIAVARPIERFYAAGQTHAVRVVEHQGRFVVQVDGARRAWVAVSGSAPTQDAHKWLATLPVTARPDARSILVLGLAGGVMLEGIPRSITHVDVIEPESTMVTANRAIAAERVVDPLEQPQIRIIANDPRRALRLSTERYDIIVTQLAPSRGSGRVPIPSRELLAELRNHLVEGGVVAQLIDGVTVSSPGVQSAAATLKAEFAHVRLYRPEPGSLLFLASATPIEPELQLARSGAPITSEIMHYSSMGMNGVEDLLAALVADDVGVEALAQSGTVRTDNGWPVDARAAQTTADAVSAAVVATDPLRQRGSWIYSNVADVANFAYLTRRLIAQNQQERALAVSDAHPDESMRLTMVGLLHASRGQTGQAIAAYQAALEQRADNAEARYLLIQPNIPLLMQAVAPPELEALTEELPGSATAVISARRAGAAQDWEAIANLDGVLGAASVTDAWYPDVVLVRAEWRSRVEQNVEQFAFDALRLIDRVVLINPDRSFFLLRAAFGIRLNNGDLAVESSRTIVRLIAQLIQSAADADGRIERRQVELIRQNLEAITSNLRGELVADNARRAEEVRQGASLILRFLDNSLIDDSQ